MEAAVLIVIIWLLIFVGLIGTIVPGLPGTGLVFGGIMLHALYFGVDTIGMTTLLLLGAVTLFSFIIDVLASLYGAKRFGASRAGVLGAVVGGCGGLVVASLPGLLLGVFMGAVAGEFFLAKKSLNDALKVGAGSMLGFLAGSVIKLLLSLAMVIVFIIKVWF